MNHSDMECNTSSPEPFPSEQVSPLRRNSTVSSAKPTTARTYGSRSSSESSRRKSSYDRGYRITGPRRINSAPYGQIPQVNRQDAIAFHEQSCALFRNLPTTSQYPTLPNLERVHSEGSSYARHYANEITYSFQAPVVSYEELNVVDEKLTIDQHDYVPPATEIRWTSDETRRQEYAEIDRANKGLKGFWRKMLPGIARKSSQSRFYTEDDGSDGESIRRYRLNMSQDDEQWWYPNEMQHKRGSIDHLHSLREYLRFSWLYRWFLFPLHFTWYPKLHISIVPLLVLANINFISQWRTLPVRQRKRVPTH